jgi:hypothetical protein
MAEPTSPPSLPSTADAAPYVPVSWMAVAAISVAAAFAVTLLALGLVAFTSKKPLLEDWLLVPPVIAIVLSFAARRVIRNSEGTRTGENLANTAWWLALVLGLCYVAYWAAFDFAIRRDARGEAKKWTDLLAKGAEEDLDDAFLRTVEPGKRQGISKTDTYALRTRFRDERLSFRNSDLLKLAQRNKGELEFTPGAVTWAYKPGTIDCVLQGTVKCPEGTFPIVLPLKGVDGVTGTEGGGGGRQWTILRPGGGGFIDQSRATRTDYGWLVLYLELTGASFGKSFVGHLAVGPTSHSYVYRAFVAPGGDFAGWTGVAVGRDATGAPNHLLTLASHLAFAVPARAWLGDAGYIEYMDKQFFKLPGGADPAPPQKDQFFKSWTQQGLKPAGDKLKDPGGNVIDKDDVTTITDTAVEVRVPVEIPLLGTQKLEVARGRVVVACTDPALLAELKQLKAAANPAQGTLNMPAEIERKKVTWRVVRIESDLLPVNLTPQGGPGGGPPGGPGMGGMPGG